MEKEMYAVVCLNSEKMSFKVWHDTFEGAKTEALRMAKSQNNRFGVIQLIGAASPQDLPVLWAGRDV